MLIIPKSQTHSILCNTNTKRVLRNWAAFRQAPAVGDCFRKTAGPAVGVALPYRASHRLDTSVQVSYAVPCRERAIGPSPCLICNKLSLYEKLFTRGFLSSDNKKTADLLPRYNYEFVNMNFKYELTHRLQGTNQGHLTGGVSKEGSSQEN